MASVRKNLIDELGEADTRQLPGGSLRLEAIPMDGQQDNRSVSPASPRLCTENLSHGEGAWSRRLASALLEGTQCC